MLNKNYFIYFLTNFTNTTFYIGVTNNLQRRMYEHENFLIEGFTKKYKLTKLIYYEEYSNVDEAVRRKKQLKNWHRDWKINLIKSKNPEFKDVSERW